MNDPTTTTISSDADRRPSASGASGSELAPELTRELRQRLAAGALIYSVAWTLAHLYFVIRGMTSTDGHVPTLFHHAIYAFSFLMGLSVWAFTRRSTASAAALSRVAVVFLLAGSLGIAATLWQAPQNIEADFARMTQAATAAGAQTTVAAYAEQLEATRVNPFHMEGPTWVAVWLLAFPFIFPMRPVHTVITSFGSTAMVPLVLGVSLLVHGVPEATGRWMGDTIIDLTIPTAICAIIASAAATRVYRLTRDLARARALGSYRLVKRIGAGGMGEVWRAEHRMLARPAAIKLIRPDALGGSPAPAGDARNAVAPRRSSSSASPTLLKRFEREAQATANLTSPHTIQVYDFGVTDDGLFYYVMELLDGLDLRSLVERFGPVPPARALRMLHHASHSLHDAHSSNLVHRDVKPANLFTCRRGLELDVIKVLDFGLVKDTDHQPGETQLTTEGATTGTPAFMAPEMIYGHERVDGRADLYALGCVGYWLLTGQLVFEAVAPMAVLVQHAKDAPVPPSERATQHVPKDLERIILDCLAKDPDARPESAAELAARLARCADFRGWTDADASAWWQTHMPNARTADAARHAAPAVSSSV